MRNDKIINEILEDIRSMSLDELKKALLKNANGPVYQAVTFNPYEAVYDCFYNAVGNYKVSKVFGKSEFLKIINELDINARVASKMNLAAANDEYYRYNLAA